MAPLLTFGQSEPVYKHFLPKNIIAKPIADTLNFVDDSLRFLMIGYFIEKKINIENCFIDKFVRQNENEITIIIRDLRDLKSEKEFEKTHKFNDSADYHTIGGTFVYNKKTKKLDFSPDQ